MPLLKTLTFGCKVNQYETELLREGLARVGYREAKDGEKVDLCVVNSCVVTGVAEAKSRKAIRRLAREHPAAEIVVMGCYAAAAAEQIAAMPGVVEVLADKRRLPDLLARFGVLDPPLGISGFGRRHRAYVKVQDGCRMDCSYCIIPSVRPVLESRPAEEVVDEVRGLAANGFREIVLTGIHLGHYGVDRQEDRIGLPQLLRQIVDLEGDFRVRLSSLEAVEATDTLIDLMAERPDRVCPHLHLSMQSGSDAVLSRMRRRQSVAQFIERCDRVREALDRPGLTTDVIVGFPGETDEEFQQTCCTVERVGFSKLHVFRFSPRLGTPAADMPDQIEPRVKTERAEELSRIGEETARRYFESLAGSRLQVLVESPVEERPGRLFGSSARYAPVELPGDAELIGRLVSATAQSVCGGRILAASDGLR